MIRRLPFSGLAWFASTLLLLQSLALNWSLVLTWPTWALAICTVLKLRECRRPFDRRLVALLQLLTAGLLAAQLQELLPSILQLITVMTALAGLLGHELGGFLSLRGLVKRTLQLLVAVLPLALVLFLLVPRMDPLWTMELGRNGAAVTGLSADLDPFSIAELVSVDGPAARMTTGNERSLPTGAYWRVLVHEQFDGRRWQHRDSPNRDSPNTSTLSGPGSRTNAEISQWWVVEPSAIQAVPWDGRSAPVSRDQWVTPEGELVLGGSSRQRRSFRLASAEPAIAWRDRPPVESERQRPAGVLPRLNQLGSRFRSLPSDRERLEALERWFRSQPFRYSLKPGQVTDLDAFLFDRQVGFCGHYASAVAALMRSADVPARVVSGYLGGEQVQPIGGSAYLDLRQSDAHAWVEVWLEGSGWQQVDPTLWIDRSAGNGSSEQAGVSRFVSSKRSWWQWLQWQWLQRQWWGLDLAWARWWLGFDQSSQQAWLQGLFGTQLRWLGLVGLGFGLAALGLGWGVLRLRLGFRPPLDQSLRVLARLGVQPQQGETFLQLCRRAAGVHPDRADLLSAMADQQQLLTYAPVSVFQRRQILRRLRRIRRSLVSRR